MNYKWNKKILYQERRKILLHLRKPNLSIENQEKCYSLLESISYLLSLPNLRQSKEKFIDSESLLKQEDYYSYFIVPSLIRKLVLRSMPSFQDYQTIENVDLPHFKLSNQELLQEAYRFVQWTHHEPFIQFFKKYYLECDDFIQIFHKNNSLEYGCLEAIYNQKNYFPFLYINRWHTIEDVNALVHESLHGYFFQTDKNLNLSNPFLYFSELEGEYADFFFPYYLEEKKLASK